MKLSHIKEALITIFTNRDIQLTLVVFGVGFLLTITATYPALEERIEEETISENNRIEARLPHPYDEPAGPDPLRPGDNIPFIDRPRLGLVNASLELKGESEDTNATVSTLDREERTLDSWRIEGIGSTIINLTREQEVEYIDFNIENGELNYNYMVRYYHQPYSLLSIPGFILMILSIIFLIRAVALMGPLVVDKKEKDRIKKNQKLIDDMIRDNKSFRSEKEEND